MPTFLDRDEVYDDIVADATDPETGEPGLTALIYNAVFRGICRLVANAVGAIYDVAKVAYLAIWPQLGDIEALRNHVEGFGVGWGTGTTEDEARKQALALYRMRMLGTAAYYENEAVAVFDEVTLAQYVAGYYGPTTAVLFVSNRGENVGAETLDALADYFGDSNRQVFALELFVRNASEKTVGFD